MKRSGPLKRKTPLRSNLATSREWERRSRKPLPQTGAKTAREASDLAAFRKAVIARADGWCEIASGGCTPGPHPGRHAHHVWPSDRDAGLHDPTRGLWLCAGGHAYVHAHPQESYARGWLGRGET